MTTSLGPTTFAMPRARLRTAEGPTIEWRSQLVPRYQRRSERVDEAILGVYLSGTNTRRIKGALAPLLHGGPLFFLYYPSPRQQPTALSALINVLRLEDRAK